MSRQRSIRRLAAPRSVGNNSPTGYAHRVGRGTTSRRAPGRVARAERDLRFTGLHHREAREGPRGRGRRALGRGAPRGSAGACSWTAARGLGAARPAGGIWARMSPPRRDDQATSRSVSRGAAGGHAIRPAHDSCRRLFGQPSLSSLSVDVVTRCRCSLARRDIALYTR